MSSVTAIAKVGSSAELLKLQKYYRPISISSILLKMYDKLLSLPELTIFFRIALTFCHQGCFLIDKVITVLMLHSLLVMTFRNRYITVLNAWSCSLTLGSL